MEGKEKKGRGREGSERKWRMIRKVFLVCLRGKGKERKRKLIFHPNLSTHGEIFSLIKLRELFPRIPFFQNPFPPDLLSKQWKFHLFKSVPFISFQILLHKQSVNDSLKMSATGVLVVWYL